MCVILKERIKLEWTKKIRTNWINRLCLRLTRRPPKSEMNRIYYRSKLNVQKLFFFNNIINKSVVLLLNEVKGEISAKEFASILVYFIENKILPLNKSFKKIIFDSDGCYYQSRNSVISSAFLNALIKHSITLEQ